METQAFGLLFEQLRCPRCAGACWVPIWSRKRPAALPRLRQSLQWPDRYACTIRNTGWRTSKAYWPRTRCARSPRPSACTAIPASLRGPCTDRAQRLHGIVEADEMFYWNCRKGRATRPPGASARHLGRTPLHPNGVRPERRPHAPLEVLLRSW